MYKIERTDYGFKVTSSGSFSTEEVEHLQRELINTLAQHDRPFSLVLDARKLALPGPEVVKVFTEIHTAIWQMSCERVVFILESPVAKRQVMQMHFIASPNGQDRVIDATKCPDWEARAIAWAAEAVEPDFAGVKEQQTR